MSYTIKVDGVRTSTATSSGATSLARTGASRRHPMMTLAWEMSRRQASGEEGRVQYMRGLSSVLCSICHGDATPRLLLLRPSDSTLLEFSRRCNFLFRPSPMISSPFAMCTAQRLHTPFLRRPHPNTRSLPPSIFLFLPFVHFLVIIPLARPTLALLTSDSMNMTRCLRLFKVALFVPLFHDLLSLP
jgi:hypothetical protein